MSGQYKCPISLVSRIQCVWWSTIRSRFPYRIVEHVHDYLLAAMLTENYIWLFQWLVACLLFTCAVSGFGQALRLPRVTSAPKHLAAHEEESSGNQCRNIWKVMKFKNLIFCDYFGKSSNLKMKIMWKFRKWTFNLSSWKTGKIHGRSWNLKNLKDYEPLITSSVSVFLRNLYFSDYFANKSTQLS